MAKDHHRLCVVD